MKPHRTTHITDDIQKLINRVMRLYPNADDFIVFWAGPLGGYLEYTIPVTDGKKQMQIPFAKEYVYDA